mmetsp:Transcript_11918/g.25757  ORF Transcript_11918/g.25757 Transcript_11918/m.25757 type:complete len:389 (+) Transcript_11918:110-1276(+)
MDDDDRRLGYLSPSWVSRFLVCSLWLSPHSFGVFAFVSSARPLQKRSSSDWTPRIRAFEEDKEYTTELPEFIPEYTGITKHIEWKLDQEPVPIQTELDLLKSGVLWRRGEFCAIPDSSDRFYEIERKCKELGMTVNQGFLIRKQTLVTKAMVNAWKLNVQYDQIERKFLSRRKTLLQLSANLDLPPVNIIRAIVRVRVEEAYPDFRERDKKIIVKNIINESDPEMLHEFLSDWEMQQLQIAKEFDCIGYTSTSMQSAVEASKWEQAIYSFLKEHDINFLTEDEMRAANSSTTPDVLLLDDCVINGQVVRWIDAKNYYGSGLRESKVMVKKTKKQIAKYEDAFGGSGAIVFKRGFSERFMQSCPATLFLDVGPLKFDHSVLNSAQPFEE